MGHLRQVAGERLPDWTNAIEPRARLAAGEALVTVAGRPLRLDWRIAGLGADGLRWRLRLDGAAAGHATGMLALGPGGLRVGGVTGTVNPGALAPPGHRPEGIVAIAEGGARLGLSPLRLRAGAGRLVWRGAGLDGVALGTGTFTLAAQGAGWQGQGALSGGTLLGEVQIAGTFESAAARLDARLDAAAPLPDDWRAALDTIGTRTSAERASWRIVRDIDLVAALSGAR